MYNRYIPQPDGSFRRSAMPERQPQPKAKHVPPPVCQPEPPPPPPRKEPPRQPQSGGGIGNFLKQLLPKDFDTSDLLIVLLLLLMAGECPEEQNSALLTLALYLFM